jgi:Fe-S cluster assembly protein SufD
VIVGEANSGATIIESYAASDNESSYFTNAIVDVVLEDGARLRHYKVQREGSRATHIATTRVDVGSHAVLRHHHDQPRRRAFAPRHQRDDGS